MIKKNIPTPFWQSSLSVCVSLPSLFFFFFCHSPLAVNFYLFSFVYHQTQSHWEQFCGFQHSINMNRFDWQYDVKCPYWLSLCSVCSFIDFSVFLFSFICICVCDLRWGALQLFIALWDNYHHWTHWFDSWVCISGAFYLFRGYFYRSFSFIAVFRVFPVQPIVCVCVLWQNGQQAQSNPKHSIFDFNFFNWSAVWSFFFSHFSLYSIRWW